MEWRDEAILLHAQPHGERDAIAVVLTFEHGKHAGLVVAGRARGRRALVEVGNRLEVVWKARLAQHLGTFTLEPVAQPAARLLDRPLELAGLVSACAMVDAGLREREPHPLLFAGLLRLIERIGAATGESLDWLADYVRFELLLLEQAGFGLDLSRCAVTGTTTGLAFVSPRTGRAVTAEAAGLHAPRLLALPPFLVEKVEADLLQIAQGLKLAGYFFTRHISRPSDQPMPAARERLAHLLAARTADDSDTD
ncbi:MAG: DNA repair protein RecO [Geminicoccaceae bacterium]|nr:DNA repair protein RecO [Geminicoccaceae bacterium]